jgi:hypothetical protein
MITERKSKEVERKMKMNAAVSRKKDGRKE